jgi:hypothetical protein
MGRLIKYCVLLFLLISCNDEKKSPKTHKVLDDVHIQETKSDVNQSLQSNSIVERKLSDEFDYNNKLNLSGISNREEISIDQISLIIVTYDSLEINQAKLIDGEDSFYTGADDLLWYNAQLLELMDSLQIPVVYSKSDTVKIRTINNNTEQIIKDSTFSLYTYFYFDGEKLKRKELLQLINE